MDKGRPGARDAFARGIADTAIKGIVCLGRHAQLDQPVAIKFLRRALSDRLESQGVTPPASDVVVEPTDPGPGKEAVDPTK